MRILIAGGTGLIGKALTSHFIKKDWEIIILARKLRSSQNPKLKYLEWDGINPGSWQEAINNVNAVINLAGESIGGSSLLNLRWTRARKTRMLQSRINAGKALSKAIEDAEKKPDVFIQASAVGYYGTENQELLTEESPVGDDFLSDVCKLWEESSEPVEKLGVRRIIGRLGVVISRENPIVGYMALPFKLFAGGKLGAGNQLFTWIHIKDVVGIFEEMLENKEFKGIYNISAPNSIPNSEVSSILGSILKRPNWFPTPAFLLKLVLGEASMLILEGQNVQPKRLLEINYEYKYSNLKTALGDVLTKNEYIQIG